MRNNSRDIEYIAQLRAMRQGPHGMLFTCEDCLYTFEATVKPERCPDCGKLMIREATEQEISWYQSVHANGNPGNDPAPIE